MLYPGYLDSSSTVNEDNEWDDPSYGPLPPGRYEIVATAGDGRTCSCSADLRGEAEVTVFLKLGP